MRTLLVIAALLALAGCKSKPATLPTQPEAPTAPDSLRKVGTELDARAGKVAAAVTVARDNADKPEVVRAETGVALSHLPKPDEGDLAIAKARAAKADQKDYAAAEAAGKKAQAALADALNKAKADQAEAKRVSDLKDSRIKELTAEVERIKKDAASQTWTLVGAALAVIGALSTAFVGPRIGIPLLLCGGFCGSVPFIIDSLWFEYAAGATLLISCGLGQTVIVLSAVIAAFSPASYRGPSDRHDTPWSRGRQWQDDGRRMTALRGDRDAILEEARGTRERRARTTAGEQ